MIEFIGIDHLTLYHPDPEVWKVWFQEILDFQSSEPSSDLLVSGTVALLLKDNPRYLALHPPGIGDLCFQVRDLQAVKDCPDLEIIEQTTDLIVTKGIEDVTFSFVAAPIKVVLDSGFQAIDHVVFNLPLDSIESLSKQLQHCFGWQPREHYQIKGNHSALTSCVLVDPSGLVQIALNEPASANSQIQEFILLNRGAGVQHIAFLCQDLLVSVTTLRSRGLNFLQPPPDYYPTRPEINNDLQQAGILVDQKGPNQRLMQIFTQPLFNEPTFFLELIQRIGTNLGFGEGNFQALFQAMEEDQIRRGKI